MENKKHFRYSFASAFLAIALIGFLLPAQARAASATLTLNRLTLTNVTDAAGLWQHEGGEVLYSGSNVGNYAAYRRVTMGGTDAQNTAMLTLTIFVLGSSPPENFTIQGAHDYSSGGYIGSVSSASGGFSFLIGAKVTGDTAHNTLTITW